jgi:hypothetical protein
VPVSLAQAQNDQGNPAVVSALRRDPGAGYLFETQGAFFTGMQSSVAGAGLSSKVKILSSTGSVTDQTDVKDGTEAVTTGVALQYQGWLEVDAIARHLEGMTVEPGDGGSPAQLLTEATAFSPSISHDSPGDFAEAIKALWHVG